MPPKPRSISSRPKASRAELAWIVAIEPSCPVLIACSISMASAPRTSPRMMRRSEEHTSELQSLMRISYAVFCLKKKNKYQYNPQYQQYTNHTKYKIKPAQIDT